MTRARDVANLIGSGNYSSTTFTATAGQTAFTIAHTQGFIQVFMNGLLLDETVDYTSNGSAVTLTSGAAAGDEIEVVAYNTFSVGDALNQAAADTRYVNASGDTMSGGLNVTGGNLGVGTSSANQTLTVAHPNHGLSLDYVGATLPAAAGLYTSSTAHTQQAYGDLNIKARSDYSGYGIGMYTASSNSTPTMRMKIDSSGRVTTPNQPSAGLRMASGDQGAYNASSTNAVMKPSTVMHNIGNHYNTSTGLFTCPVAGRYLVQFSGNFYNSGAGAYHIITIMKNSGSFTWNYHNGMTNSWTHISNNIIISCAANDTLSINNGTQSGSGGGSDVGKYSYISYQLIG